MTKMMMNATQKSFTHYDKHVECNPFNEKQRDSTKNIRTNIKTQELS